MRPQTIGRVLGIGVRVATRTVGHCLAGQGASAATAVAASASLGSEQGRPVGQTAGQTIAQGGHGVARGLRGFLRPFQRVGSIVWLEVSGIFFLLFVLVFARGLWYLRGSFTPGADHYKIVTDVVLMLLFLYLSVSSFWRAWHK